jgi:hypothetical protein
LFGSFHGEGYSIEWHDFHVKREFDWAASFHPGCVELCLNLDGAGFVEGRGSHAEFEPNTVWLSASQQQFIGTLRQPPVAALRQNRTQRNSSSCARLQKQYNHAR